MSSWSLFILVFFSVSCAPHIKSERNPEEISYSFEAEGCSTGLHSFSELRDLCAGLLDETKNASCALDKRQTYFNDQCSSFPDLLNSNTYEAEVAFPGIAG